MSGAETLSCLVQVSPRTDLGNRMLTKGPTPTCFPRDPPERPPCRPLGPPPAQSRAPHTACSQRGRALETFLPGVREDVEGQAGPRPEGTGQAALRLGTQQRPEGWARTRALTMCQSHMVPEETCHLLCTARKGSPEVARLRSLGVWGDQYIRSCHPQVSPCRLARPQYLQELGADFELRPGHALLLGPPLALSNAPEEVGDGPRDDALLLRGHRYIEAGAHGVCLPGPRLQGKAGEG